MHFKLIIFFNLLTFSKTFNQGSWLAVLQWCHTYVLHKLRIKAWVDKESWWSVSWYQQSQIGVVWFCQLETNPVTLNLFIYHHGTGPSSESTPFCLSVLFIFCWTIVPFWLVLRHTLKSLLLDQGKYTCVAAAKIMLRCTVHIVMHVRYIKHVHIYQNDMINKKNPACLSFFRNVCYISLYTFLYMDIFNP